jgi:hypothetical protein
MLIITKSKAQRQAEEKRQYVKEEARALDGMVTARTGRPGEREEYPDLGAAYWARRTALNEFK